MKTDARIRYTKFAIRNAFLELLKKYPIEKITVADICRIAEINRATFYRYYENPYDLLSALENEMFAEIKQSSYEYKNDIDKLTENIFTKFYEQKETWTLLLSDHADLGFQNKIYSFFNEYFAKTTATKESELRYRFLLYGYSGIFNYWIQSGMQETPKEISSYIGKFRRNLITNL